MSVLIRSSMEHDESRQDGAKARHITIRALPHTEVVRAAEFQRDPPEVTTITVDRVSVTGGDRVNFADPPGALSVWQVSPWAPFLRQYRLLKPFSIHLNENTPPLHKFFVPRNET